MLIVKLKGKYISEEIDIIEKAIRENKKVLIQSDTGSGKTTTILSSKNCKSISDVLFHLYKLSNNANKNYVNVLALTTLAKVSEDAKEYNLAVVSGGDNKVTDDELLRLLEKNKTIVTTHAYLYKLLYQLERVGYNYSVLFDEYHYLQSKFGLNGEQYKKYLRLISKSKNCFREISFSATIRTSLLDNDISHLKFMTPIKHKKRIKVDICEYDEKYDYYLQNHFLEPILEKKENDLTMIFINSIKQMEMIRKSILKRFHYLKDENIVCFHADNKYKKSYKWLLESSHFNESVDENIKIVLTTCLLEDSINFFTDRNLHVGFITMNEKRWDAVQFAQFLGRSRKSKSINAKIFITRDNSEKFKEIYKSVEELNKDIETIFELNYERALKKTKSKYGDIKEKFTKAAKKNFPNNLKRQKEYIENRTSGLNSQADESLRLEVKALTMQEFREKHIGINNMVIDLLSVMDNVVINKFHINRDLNNLTKDDSHYYETTDENDNAITKERKGGTTSRYKVDTETRMLGKSFYKLTQQHYEAKGFDSLFAHMISVVFYDSVMKDFDQSCTKNDVHYFINELEKRMTVIKDLPKELSESLKLDQDILFSSYDEDDKQFYCLANNHKFNSMIRKQLVRFILKEIEQGKSQHEVNSLVSRYKDDSTMPYSVHQLKKINLFISSIDKDSCIVNNTKTYTALVNKGVKCINLKDELELLMIDKNFSSKTVRARFLN